MEFVAQFCIDFLSQHVLSRCVEHLGPNWMRNTTAHGPRLHYRGVIKTVWLTPNQPPLQTDNRVSAANKLSFVTKRSVSMSQQESSGPVSTGKNDQSWDLTLGRWRMAGKHVCVQFHNEERVLKMTGQEERSKYLLLMIDHIDLFWTETGDNHFTFRSILKLIKFLNLLNLKLKI